MKKHTLLQRLLPLAMLAAMLLSAVPTAAAFRDTAGHWAEKMLDEWQDEGLIDGYGDGSFQPNGTVTRAEFIKLVNRTQIKNPTWFVSLDTKLIVNVENTLMETIGQQVFSVPVHAGKGYTLTLPVVATYPGLLKISVSRVYIKDLMGFFRLKKNVEQTAELSILPRAVTDIAYEKTALEQGMLESEESSKRGNDFSDVQEVREYIPGDKLMSIHWKLSAKRDILMVKDRVSMSDHQLVIVPELFIDQPVNLAKKADKFLVGFQPIFPTQSLIRSWL